MEEQLPTVLILDERRIYRDLLSVLFEKHNFQCHTASNGAEALGRLRERPTDLLIMDIELKEMEGIEFLQRLRHNEATQKLPVIILTDVCEKTIHHQSSLTGNP